MYKIIIFLILAILSNLIVLNFGELGVIINATLLIPIDMFIRDKLHEQWHGKSHLWRSFILLFICAGGVSILINKDTWIVAVASTVAFLISNIIDTIIYDKLFYKPVLVKMNVSNLFSTLVDVGIFIGIVFGFNYKLMLLQFILKFGVGIIFTFLYSRIQTKQVFHNNK